MNVSNLFQLEIIRISYPNSLIVSKCEYLTLINLFETWITNGLLCHYFGPKCQLLCLFCTNILVDHVSSNFIINYLRNICSRKSIIHEVCKDIPQVKRYLLSESDSYSINSFYASMDTYINLCELSINCAVIFSSRLLHFD